MQGIDLGEERFLDFILVQDYTQFPKGRIFIRFSEFIIFLIKFFFAHLAGSTNAVLIRVEGLYDEIRRGMFDKRFVQKIEIPFCRRIVRNIQSEISVEE